MIRCAACRLRGFLGAAAVFLLMGCAGDPLVDLTPRTRSALTLPLSGAYDVTAQAPFSGSLTARFLAEPTDEGFTARTRPGIAWEMVGGLAGLFGPVFAPTVFPDGVILQWTSALPTEAGPGEGWIGVAGVPALGARTRITSAGEPVEVVSKEGRRIALLRVKPVSRATSSGTDYAALAESIEAAVGRELFDPVAASSGGVRAYGRRLREVAGLARDDAEFVFGAVLAARAYVRFSMPVMWRRGDPQLGARFAAWPERERGTVGVTFDEKDGLGVLKSEAFMDGAEVERVMNAITERQPKGLILDLRSCPGVTLSSLLVLTRLVEEPLDAGVYVGARRRADVLAGGMEGLRTVRVSDATSVRELEGVLQREGAARVVIEPAASRYRGPAYVLTNKRTSTSSEPLVWLLQHSGRAEVIGQSTAGRPLLSKPIDVGQSWVMWVAAYDYVPPTGLAARFNGVGVKPQIASRDPLGEARRRLSGGG